ncbi:MULTISPECIES: ABC transporter substrate-binding protein [unclassified Mesorhizobium]|uniref:ABC transporter substrate-binding protein n=1 Tax=unclassified Mesorhizobium TaxID=325217 RepID=UPI000FCBC4A4|nr:MULTISPECIES: ABC transporter substrate-binding protein [unclassified Mesorhizobium]RUT89281.1 amino acid ABC transporter substrate-binding protein [Mesorhizobium sp. M7A.T.Ca.US.000.02.1.1]RUU06120.1 amino acid ABC transporter substrate-binding protein [Mesorhizobium sp. M7A.T.Ca.TU.009.02.1.1]RUU76189.1 amino acid ABC transporter substrate-binding protein [Mesorhizobium sp. M7A.T.Ca.TU.009.01.1.2]
MMNRRAMLQGAVGAGAAGAALLADMNTAAIAQDTKPIPVGSALPMSGIAAADGIEFKNGLELAAEEINAAGGILGRPVEIHIEDTKEMGADLVSQSMQRLIDRFEAPVIINGYNLGTNMIEMDVAADNDVIMMHYNTLISHNEKFKTDPARYYSSFQGDPPEFWYGPGCLNFLKTLAADGKWKAPNKKIAIIPSANEYSIVIANAIRDKAAEYGFEVSLFETVPFPTNQWGPTLAKLRQDPPAAILVTHFLPQDLAQFMVQFLAEPINSLIYMQYGPSLPAFREIGGEAVNGVVYSTVIGCLPDDFSKPFRESYRAKFGPNSAYITGSQTYDGLWMWALAAAIAGGPGEPMDKAQTTKVANAMKRLVYRGVNGTYRADPAGQSAFCYPTQVADPSLGMPHQFLQHQDYKTDPKLIAPVLYATDSFILPPWVK